MWGNVQHEMMSRNECIPTQIFAKGPGGAKHSHISQNFPLSTC